MNSIAQAPNATTNGGDASRVGIEKGGKYKLYQIIAESFPDARRVAPISACVFYSVWCLRLVVAFCVCV